LIAYIGAPSKIIVTGLPARVTELGRIERYVAHAAVSTRRLAVAVAWQPPSAIDLQ
jgi:hypothetical protein